MGDSRERLIVPKFTADRHTVGKPQIDAKQSQINFKQS
jgi:hypothetical protein